MGSEAIAAPAGRGLELGRVRELVVHLALREMASMHRFTFLGWAWPLIRQLAYWAVLVLVFTRVLDLGIDDYEAFVFSGLVAWTWFATGLGTATNSLVANRHLLFQSRFPAVVLPLVAVVVPLIDVLIAVPVLVLMLGLSGELHATTLLAPLLMIIQLVLMAGLAWLLAAAQVYVRDVAHAVTVALTLLFYLTPVFYELARVPSGWDWLVRLNPMSTLVDGYHDVLLSGDVPGAPALGAIALAAVVLAGAGLAVFRRLEPGFVDEL